MTSVLLRELECVRDNTLIVEHNAGTDDSFVHLIQVTVERNGVNLLLVKFRVRQLSCEITIIREQQHTGCITIETTNWIDTFRTSVTNDINHRVTLLRIVGSSNRIFRLVEQNIHFSFTTNRLVMEANIIRRKHLSSQIINHFAIYRNNTCLDKIISLTTGTDSGVSEEFVQTNRLRRVFILLTIDLLLVSGVKVLITFRFMSHRTLRTGFAITRKTRTAFSVAGKMRTAFSVACKMRTSGMLSAVTRKTRTTYMFCALTLEPRSGATCSFIVGIVVKHKIIYDLTIYDF